MTISGDADYESADITTSFNNCVEYGTTMNGSMRLTGSSNGSNIDMRVVVSNLTTYDYESSVTMNMTVDAQMREYDSDYMDIEGKLSSESTAYSCENGIYVLDIIEALHSSYNGSTVKK